MPAFWKLHVRLQHISIGIPSNRPGKTEFAEERPLTEARFDLKGLSGWVRAEVVDVFGKKAWTNAIILE